MSQNMSTVQTLIKISSILQFYLPVTDINFIIIDYLNSQWIKIIAFYTLITCGHHLGMGDRDCKYRLKSISIYYLPNEPIDKSISHSIMDTYNYECKVTSYMEIFSYNSDYDENDDLYDLSLPFDSHNYHLKYFNSKIDQLKSIEEILSKQELVDLKKNVISLYVPFDSSVYY